MIAQPRPSRRLPHGGGILAVKQAIGARDRDPLKAQVLGERAHAGAEDSGKMDAAAAVSRR